MDISTKPEVLCTVGLRKLRQTAFRIDLNGDVVSELFQLLEHEAIASQNYLDVRRAVGITEIIRDQVRKQGFYVEV